MKTKFNILIISTLTTLLFLYGCKDFLDIDLAKDQVVSDKVFTNDETAIATIRGIYSKMISGFGMASGNTYSVTFIAGRSADDFTSFISEETLKEFSSNNILPGNTRLRQYLWQETYQIIYAANSVLENLERSNQVSNAVKQQLNGEAKFIRAFCHFYLCNLFGSVPLILTTDYRINALAPANTNDEIYNQIIKDLIDSKNLLSDNYPSSERIRPNKWATAALLARAYLYHKNWTEAEKESSEIIGKSDTYRLVDDLNLVFVKASQEAILQFAIPVAIQTNTNEGRKFILTAAPGSSTDVVLSNEFISAFEPGDERFAKWIGTFTSGATTWRYPFKYKLRNNTQTNEYSIALRLAEQYLIRAEARIHLNKIELGIADLNAIRKRARALPGSGIANPLPDLPSGLSLEDALMAVEKERRIELFAEWGHRWLDLKRTNRANAILEPIKSPNWQSTDVLYPIPTSELLNNKNLKQNPGYQ